MHAQTISDTRAESINGLLACGPLSKPAERSTSAADSITALGEMTRGIAHDFRNVLSILTSGLNVAQTSAGDPAKLKLAFDAMHDGISRGQKMTDQLLAFARREEFPAGAKDINALLSALKVFLGYSAGPGIRIVLELAPGLPKCLVDPQQLNAAILNLIVNSRDAMPAGGVIRVRTDLVRRGLGEGREYVRVRVQDNGAGMPPEVLARVFDPFFTTKGEGGTGLGVPQVQALMRQVEGSVSVHSKVGKGTAFDLLFPVQAAASTESNESAQLDRWADEGGAIGPAPSPRSRKRVGKVSSHVGDTNR